MPILKYDLTWLRIVMDKERDSSFHCGTGSMGVVFLRILLFSRTKNSRHQALQSEGAMKK